MNTIQIAELLDLIQSSYPGKFNIQDPTRLLASWERVLSKHDFDQVMKNFERDLENSVFPPTIADLVKQRPLDRINGIPNADETQEYLRSLEEEKQLNQKAIHSIEQSKAEIRRILGRV